MSEADSNASPKDHSGGKRQGFLYSIFSSLGINRQLPIPLFSLTPWPSAELKHTLLARVPVGAALWGVEVVSEWRLRETVTAGAVKWPCTDRQREK